MVELIGVGRYVEGPGKRTMLVSTMNFGTQAEAMTRYVDIVKKVGSCSINGISLNYDEKMEAQLNKGWSKTAIWTLPANHAYSNTCVQLILSKADETYTLIFEVARK
jgi:hypothetical protein